MANRRTHYDNLQVKENASAEVIKGAYRFLCQRWHPDKNSASRQEAERIGVILNAAYAVLSDPVKRKAYDAQLARARAADQRASNGSPAGAESSQQPPQQPPPSPCDRPDNCADVETQHRWKPDTSGVLIYMLVIAMLLMTPVLLGLMDTGQSRSASASRPKPTPTRESNSQATAADLRASQPEDHGRPVEAPKFLSYQAERYKGPSAPVLLSGVHDHRSRARITNTLSRPVDFAGEYTLDIWGCGAQCLTGVAVSKRTGKATWLPGTICCWQGGGERIIYRADSSLIVLAGLVDGAGVYGAHFYNMSNGEFVHVASIATPGTPAVWVPESQVAAQAATASLAAVSDSGSEAEVEVDAEVRSWLETFAAGMNAMANDDLATAAYYFRGATRIATGLLHQHEKGHDMLLESTIAWAGVLHMQGEYDHALDLLRGQLDFARSGLQDDDPRYSTILNNLGLVLIDAGRPVEAETILHKALSIRMEHEPSPQINVAVTRLNLGKLYLDRGSPRIAITHLERALIIYLDAQEQLSGNNPQQKSHAMDLLPIMTNLIQAHVEVGNHAVADESFRAQIAFIKGTVSPSLHPRVLRPVLGEYSAYLRSRMEYQKADDIEAQMHKLGSP